MNPFRYTEPLPPSELIDRDSEASELLDRAGEGNNSRLVAPRRYGKTSLLRRVLEDAAKQDWATVYVDFFGVLTLADVAQRIERAYSDQLRGRLGSWFAGLRRELRPTLHAGGGPVPAELELRLDPGAEEPLLDRLAIPRRILERHGVRTLAVFDEFQDVLAAQVGADAVIRSEIQHHADAASYVFAGSQVGMMRELFADRRRAFYGQATPVDLRPLAPQDVAEAVTARFAQTKRDVGVALDPLLDLAAGHPQRTMLLAHALWAATEPGRAATEETWHVAYQVAMREVGDELRAIWSSLPGGQRRALAAIAAGDAPLYAANRRHGGSRGGAVHAAVESLRGRGEIVEDPGARTGYAVVDPLLAEWLRAGRPGI